MQEYEEINNNYYQFPDCFNEPLTKEIIDLIGDFKTIYFGKQFNQPLDNLPDHIETIDLGRCREYNHRLDNLPSNLKYLYIGGNFNHPVDFLPFGLLQLELPWCFNQPIDNLPRSLKILKLDCFFYQSLNNLPEGLEILTIMSASYNLDLDQLPSSIKKLYVYESYKGKIKKGINVQYM